jgi:hypothetical protein
VKVCIMIVIILFKTKNSHQSTQYGKWYTISNFLDNSIPERDRLENVS